MAHGPRELVSGLGVREDSGDATVVVAHCARQMDPPVPTPRISLDYHGRPLSPSLLAWVTRRRSVSQGSESSRRRFRQRQDTAVSNDAPEVLRRASITPSCPRRQALTRTRSTSPSSSTIRPRSRRWARFEGVGVSMLRSRQLTTGRHILTQDGGANLVRACDGTSMHTDFASTEGLLVPSLPLKWRTRRGGDP